jgi:hypothetical protein
VEMNLNYWGYLAVATGVVVCFGPALFVWIKAELSDRAEAQKRPHNPD